VAVFPRLGTVCGGAAKLLNSDTGVESSDVVDEDDDFFFVGITDIYYADASLDSFLAAMSGLSFVGDFPPRSVGQGCAKYAVLGTTR
jgi:hypothetical protein